MTEVKKRSKKDNFYFTVFQKIKEGLNPAQISKALNISKQGLQYYISKLKRGGHIQRKGYGTWGVLKEVKDFSMGMGLTKPLTNLHALEIKFPIISGQIPDKDWIIKNQLKNWLPKYKGLANLGGLTLRNNNNKSLTVWAKSRNILDLNEVDNLAFKIKAFIHEYFKNKYDVVLDVFNCETKNLNLATEDKQSESMIREGEKFELNLNKKAEKIFPPDSIDAKAWIDGSPFDFSAETNDKEWKRAYLHMPFKIMGLAESMPVIQEYNKNIMLHMAVQEKQLENLELANHLNLENLKTQKRIQLMLGEEPLPGHSYRPAIRKINGKIKLKQKTLHDFF